MNILITGANGFIGHNLINYWDKGKHNITALVRKDTNILPSWVKVDICDFCSNSERFSDKLRKNLKNIDVVIHLAGVAHVKLPKNDEKTVLKKCNTDSTIALAKLSEECGVGCFIYMSSVGVHGLVSTNPFSEVDIPNPCNNYALSKLNAENGLRNLVSTSKMKAIAIRPPLVYGPSAPGSVGALIRWAERPYPLPLGSIQNKKSFIALDNLIDFIDCCTDANQSIVKQYEVFLVSDGVDVSTTQFLEKLLLAYKRKNFLIPFPVFILKFFMSLLGRRTMSNQLFGSLQIDNSKSKNLLGWRPKISMEEQLSKMTNR